jgi:hypothetical protein
MHPHPSRDPFIKEEEEEEEDGALLQVLKL